MPKILVCIPTYNGAHRVDYLLQSIFMKTGQDIDYKIMICDDSGKKEHQEKTKLVANKWSSKLPIGILINDKNIGVAKSWNKLIKLEDSQNIILINDDVIVDNDWLKNMVYFLDNNPNAGVAYYTFMPIEESNIPKLLSNSYQLSFNNIVPLRYMQYIGCFFGFSRDKYNMIRGFDENYFANFEETDFCTALAYHGYPSYILRCPTCLHVWKATFKSAPEINYQNIFKESEQYYSKKWNGNRETTTNRYMSKIPFQKVRWICEDNVHEEISTDNYGYFKVEINSENRDIKIVT